MNNSTFLVLTCVKDLLASGDYSDLTITCGGETYKVHKAIVCGRAGFFKNAIAFGGQEAQKGIIDLPEDEPGIIKLLLQYLYEGEYEPILPTANTTKTTRLTSPPTKGNKKNWKERSSTNFSRHYPHSCGGWGGCNSVLVCEHHQCGYSCDYDCQNFTCEVCASQSEVLLQAMPGDADQLLIHCKMYELGDKYDVVGLKDLAKEKSSRACKFFWNTSEFAVAANHAFSTTPENDRGLRDVFCDTISEHIELAEEPAVRVLLTQFNGMALGILDAKIKEYGWGKKK